MLPSSGERWALQAMAAGQRGKGLGTDSVQAIHMGSEHKGINDNLLVYRDTDLLLAMSP
jgi:hypothetical protein